MKNLNLKTMLVIILLLVMLSSTFGKKQDYQIHHLRNGLTVITKEIHIVPVTSMYVFYGVGSINEYGRIGGISHIVEHMMFKGTDKFAPNDIDRLVKSVGGSHNAYTTFDYTAYYINLPSNAIDIGLMIEADRMGNSRMDQKDWATEKYVIMEERRMRTDNSPYGTFWERYRQVTYPRHPYRHPIIGYMPDIEKITIDQIKEYYKKYYQPNNATLVLVGDFNTREIMKKVKKHFGSLEKGPDIPKAHIPQELPKGSRTIKLKDVRNKYYLAYYSFRTPTYDSEDYPVLNAIPLIMSRTHTARLNDLVDQGIALGVNCAINGGRDPQTMIFILYSRNEEDLMKCEKVLFDEIERLKNEPITDNELKIIKNSLDSDFVFSYQSADNVAQQLGYFYTVATLDYLDNLRDKYQAITKQNIMEVSKKYLDREYVIKGYLFPDTSGKTPPPTPTAAMDEDSHGKTYDKTAEPKIDLKKYLPEKMDYNINLKDKIDKKVLPNGLVIVALQNPAYDIVSLKGTLHAGPAFDPVDKHGLATLTVSCLEYGTKSRDKDQIDLEKDIISLRGEIDTGLETVTFNYSMVSDQFEPAMDLVSDFVRNPSFPKKFFEQEKMNYMMYHQALAQNPEELVDKTFKQLLYGQNHPYANYKYGNPQDIQNLTVQDLQQFHKENYGPEHTIIGVVGPLSTDKMIEIVEKQFEDWPKSGKLNEVNFPEVEKLNTVKSKSLSLPGRTQTYIRMGWPGIKVGDEDYYPLMVLNFIMGGGSLSSRLGKEIRVKSGLAYSVYSYIHPRTLKGSINIILNTKAGNEEIVKKKIIKVVEDIKKNGLTDDEIFIAKQYVVNSRPRTMETNGQLVGSIEYMEYMNLPYDYYDNLVDNVKKVTKEDINRVANKYLDTQNYIWVTVGP